MTKRPRQSLGPLSFRQVGLWLQVRHVTEFLPDPLELGRLQSIPQRDTRPDRCPVVRPFPDSLAAYVIPFSEKGFPAIGGEKLACHTVNRLKSFLRAHIRVFVQCSIPFGTRSAPLPARSDRGARGNLVSHQVEHIKLAVAAVIE